MNRITTGLSALLLIATSGIPAAAQQADRASETVTYILCTGDYVCANDPSVVATWPLERWRLRAQAGPAGQFDGAVALERSAATGRHVGRLADPNQPVTDIGQMRIRR